MNNSTSKDEPIADADNHGKLAHLNAVNLSGLTLAKRYAYITLFHPPNSDELGRLMTHGGALPNLPALTDREARLAIDGLIADELLRKWEHGGSDCYELKGAYAYKRGLMEQLAERRRISIRKRQEFLKRKQRRKAAKEGIAFADEDDGSFTEDSKVVELVRSQRGNLVPTRPGVWFNSKVPPPPGQRSRHKMMLAHPDSTEGCILRMLPDFNPGEGLSTLRAVLRFYLLIESDDFGRVSLDVNRLHRQLGPAITKRVTKSDIRCELREMVKLGQLKDFKKTKGWFAYLKDSTQHMMKNKRYDAKIPKLYDDKKFTYDSDRYLAFFKACEEHAATRARTHVGAFSEKGKLKVVTEYVGVAAKRFLEDFERFLSREPYCTWTPEQLMQLEVPSGFQGISNDYSFYYGASTNQPAEWLEILYQQYQDEYDGTGGGSAAGNTHLILTHLLGMTPAEFVEQAKMDNSRPPGIVP